jgi:F-type H+-transporting ATPase subunit alpha
VRKLEIGDISRYEQEMLSYLRSEHGDLLGTIRDTGKVDDAAEQKLIAALDAFGSIFQPTKKAVEAA